MAFAVPCCNGYTRLHSRAQYQRKWGEFMPATPPALPLTGIGEENSFQDQNPEMEESSAFEVPVARSSANEITLPSVTVADVFVLSHSNLESVICQLAKVNSGSPMCRALREELSPPSSRESVDQAMELTKQSLPPQIQMFWVRIPR